MRNFLSPVDVGESWLMIDFETSSSDMKDTQYQTIWTYNQGHAVFDPYKFKTSRIIENSSFEVYYGDDSFASGSANQGSVSIGGKNVPNQAIGLPDKITPEVAEDTRTFTPWLQDGLYCETRATRYRLRKYRPQSLVQSFHN